LATVLKRDKRRAIGDARIMAYTINAQCTACGLCLPTCPIDAIAIGDPIYVIDQESCCDFEDCLAVCPVNAIVLSGSAQAANVQAGLRPAIPSVPAPS
jgi:electron transfer flavoprotein alpha subunit